MHIAIIGAGHIGGTLARRWTQLGHHVTIANSRGPETLTDLAVETGAIPCTISDVVKGANVIVVTIPEKNVPQLPSDLFAQVSEDTVVIDTGNYYPQQRDGKIEDIENGMTESRWVEQQLGRAVVKAFNNIYFKHLLERGVPAGTPGRIALPVAGDVPAAKDIVMKLVDELGFDAVDAGGIDESWRQQPGTPAYGADADVEGLKAALQAASPARTSEWRA